MKTIAVVIVALATVATAQGEPRGSAQTVLFANHLAVGSVPTTGTMELRYSNTSSGMTGPQVVRYDLATAPSTASRREPNGSPMRVRCSVTGQPARAFR